MNVSYIFFSVILLGIIQGVTEFLPISSTAHLMIAEQFLHLSDSKEFVNLFLVLIQAGSALAVFVSYFFCLSPIARSKSESISNIKLWAKILVASLPAALLGLLLDPIISKYESWILISFTLMFYGIIYIIIEVALKNKNKNEIPRGVDITYRKAFFIGLFQSLAIIPGTSRSGSSILGGYILGLSREAAVEFSFFMAIPVILGASVLRLLKSYSAISLEEWVFIALGTFISFIVSLLVIKGLVKYLKTHTFIIFGIYRVILSLILVLVFLLF